MKGSEAQKRRSYELLWMLWFDKKKVYLVHTTRGESWMMWYFVKKKLIIVFFCLGVLHLTVLDEDEAIITQPKNVTVEIGKTAYMSCSSHSDLIQNPTWVKIEENNVTILTEG